MIASTLGIRPKALRRNCSLRSVSFGSSIGSHWYGVPGLGTKGFTEGWMRPMRPRLRPTASIRARICSVRETIASTSSCVSPGRPTM